MDDHFLNKVEQTIANHLDDEKFGVGELASEVGLSKSQTFRKVKSLTGKSISQIIKEIRLQKAAKLLLETDLHASEISYKIGFSSPSYFNKCFSKYYGITPGEYKENGQEIPFKNPFDTSPARSKINKLHWVLSVFGVALLFFGIILFVKNTINSPKISIAVLYFDDHSPSLDMQWYSNSVTEAITSKLSNIKNFMVTSRISVKQFRNSNKSIPEIAKALGVDYILEGSSLRLNDSIFITVQLVGKKDGHKWSQSFSESYENSLLLLNNVSKYIANRFEIELGPKEEKRIEKYPTYNKDAYNLFLQAEYQRNKYNNVALNNALKLYEEAIALDSTFLEAYIAISDIWQFRGIVWGLYSEQEAWNKSKKYLQIAKRFDSDNKQLEYNLHFGSFYYEWAFESMEKYYQKILLKPNYYNVTGVTQDYAIKTGRFDGAFLINKRHILNNDLISYLFAYKAEILMFQGKKKEAINILKKYNSLYNDDLFYLRESTKLYFYLGEYEMSKNQLKKIRIKFPDDNPSIFTWLDAIFAQMDNNKENVKLYLDQLINRYETINSGSPAWFIALYYCYIKDYENTFIWLQRSYDRHEVEMTWLREEPLLIPLRDDKRYKDLYQKIGF